MPATVLGMALGPGGFGNGWRAARRWGAPALVGEALSLAAVLLWFVWLALYALKCRADEFAGHLQITRLRLRFEPVHRISGYDS